MNRLTGITYPDGATAGFGYDLRGRRISVTDQNNKTTTYTYDDADRLTAVTDPASNTTQYAYDTEDNLLSITDANSHTTQFAYNARGWVTQTTFPSTLQRELCLRRGRQSAVEDRSQEPDHSVRLRRAEPADAEDVSGLDRAWNTSTTWWARCSR